MKSRTLKYTERLVTKTYPDGRTISVGGKIRKIPGCYRMKVGVAICCPGDRFEETVAYDKTMGRAKSKDFGATIDVADKENIDRALIDIADKVDKNIHMRSNGSRPYIIPLTL